MSQTVTTHMSDREGEVYRLIRDDQPIDRRKLRREVGLRDRQVRDLIARLRSKHRVPIIGGRRGYRIADSDEEVLAFTSVEIRKGATIIRHMRELERSLDVHPRLPLEGNGDRPVAATQSRGTATCDLCGAPLRGRQERWCSEWCKQTYWGRRAS